MVVVRMVLDCGDDDDEKKKVVGSWFVLLQVCTIGCAVQSCYVTIFENCDQTDHPVCAQRSMKGRVFINQFTEATAYSSRARLFLKANRRDRSSNTSCGLGFRGFQKKRRSVTLR